MGFVKSIVLIAKLNNRLFEMRIQMFVGDVEINDGLAAVAVGNVDGGHPKNKININSAKKIVQNKFFETSTQCTLHKAKFL